MAGERILIVEDEYVTALAIKDVLEDFGYIVAGKVKSGVEAIAKAGELKPDLVLMDISLDGEMSGVEAAGKIIDERKIPVVYITAHTDNETFKKASQTKFSDFIIKPFSDKELEECIDRVLNKQKL